MRAFGALERAGNSTAGAEEVLHALRGVLQSHTKNKPPHAQADP